MTTMDLSPRDIQRRIRAGESPVDVAAAAGCELSAIEGFVVPILAEREHMVTRALSTPVRRRFAAGRLVPLGELLADDVEPTLWSTASWDAWRRDDAAWTVEASFPDGRTAEFLFDPVARFVVADSPEAFDLVGDLDHSDEMAVVDSLSHPQDRENTLQLEHSTPAAAAEPTPDVQDEASPVRSLKEARDRRAVEQLTIDLGSTFADPPPLPEPTETQDAAEPEPTPRSSRGPRRDGDWTQMLFGSND